MLDSSQTMTSILSGFIEYMKVERHYSPKTIKKYLEDIQCFQRIAGDLEVAAVGLQHFITVKSALQSRGAQCSRISGVVAAMKSLLRYGQDVLQLPVIDLGKIRGPRVPRKEVIYLTPEELATFSSAIPLTGPWSARPSVVGYGLRALVEVLAASAMRISEVLALNRESIDFQKREALIVGKGNKQRTVFFTQECLQWLDRYLLVRTDHSSALFVTKNGDRLTTASVHKMFERISDKAALGKRITPHILRHTAATNLLRNGCPIGYIKEILGHDRLETTCHYYLGALNKAEAKDAFDSYMRYNAQFSKAAEGGRSVA